MSVLLLYMCSKPKAYKAWVESVYPQCEIEQNQSPPLPRYIVKVYIYCTQSHGIIFRVRQYELYIYIYIYLNCIKPYLEDASSNTS